MGIREELGGRIEKFLNESIDKNLNLDSLKQEAHEFVDRVFDENLEKIKHKIKADFIDLIDGEDDIK